MDAAVKRDSVSSTVILDKRALRLARFFRVDVFRRAAADAVPTVDVVDCCLVTLSMLDFFLAMVGGTSLLVVFLGFMNA